ncbi:4Fe-4S ferredoxin [Methanocella sp. CWC-04]|uniref:4Fe-4S ferredoxin n=1 Tax=Methanooceanicella nereidis TaxID=2052831 RepID=A0AAP2RD03_9EURY|nr:4Fe-4S binding protein [Methanocella sp. CWC-04]MCD1294847.1 4Fe-4S ferredoxin [Methanocella sp. CWC-04]
MSSGDRRDKKAFGVYAGIMYHTAALGIRLSKLPVLGRLFETVVSKERLKAVTVPVNLPLQDKYAILHFDAAQKLIEASSYICATNTCVCREGNGCKEYPADIGCMFLGQGARDITLKGRVKEISKDEALSRLERSRSLGLVNNIIWSSVEIDILGGDPLHTIELCSCCPCCCLAFRTREGSRAFIDGISGFCVAKVISSGSCVQCLKCERSCPFHAINVSMHGRPMIDGSRCKGCGRCEVSCDKNVLKVFPLEHEGGCSSPCSDAGVNPSGIEYLEQFLSMVK